MMSSSVGCVDTSTIGHRPSLHNTQPCDPRHINGVLTQWGCILYMRALACMCADMRGQQRTGGATHQAVPASAAAWRTVTARGPCDQALGCSGRQTGPASKRRAVSQTARASIGQHGPAFIQCMQRQTDTARHTSLYA